MAVGSCPTCSYPISAQFEGQKLNCPFCGIKLEAMDTQGLSIPISFIVGIGAFVLGLIVARKVGA